MEKDEFDNLRPSTFERFRAPDGADTRASGASTAEDSHPGDSPRARLLHALEHALPRAIAVLTRAVDRGDEEAARMLIDVWLDLQGAQR